MDPNISNSNIYKTEDISDDEYIILVTEDSDSDLIDNDLEPIEYDEIEEEEELDNSKLICVICKKIKNTEEELIKHQQKHLNYHCDKCDKKYYTENLLKRHKYNAHLPSKNVECPFCKAIFRTNYGLKQHLYTHSKERTFHCKFEGCDLKFKQISTLQAHEKIHKNKHRTKCPKCGIMVTRLAIHILSHNDEKTFQCTKCDKSFYSKNGLRTHSEIHEENKLLMCSICDKVFSYQSTLLKHNNTIHIKKIHTCTQCKKNFNRKDNMIKHMKTVHRLNFTKK